MGSEIAIGHSFVRGGDMPGRADARPAACSAPTSPSRTGATASRKIYDDESWNPDLRAPLAAPGIDVRVGDYLLAINGAELPAPDDIYRLLDGTANRQTVLLVNARRRHGRRAPRHRGAGREREPAPHARLGRAQPPHGRLALARPARLRLPAEHRPARLPELQPLLFRAAGPAGRGHRRAVQRRRLGGRLHHRPAAARTSTATSTTSPATACRSPAPRPASGGRR